MSYVARIARALLFASAFGLCAPHALLAQDSEPQAKPRPLRIMTYNIKHGQTNATCTQPPRLPGQPPFPDCNLDLNASIEVIRATF